MYRHAVLCKEDRTELAECRSNRRLSSRTSGLLRQVILRIIRGDYNLLTLALPVHYGIANEAWIEGI